MIILIKTSDSEVSRTKKNSKEYTVHTRKIVLNQIKKTDVLAVMLKSCTNCRNGATKKEGIAGKALNH